MSCSIVRACVFGINISTFLYFGLTKSSLFMRENRDIDRGSEMERIHSLRYIHMLVYTIIYDVHYNAIFHLLCFILCVCVCLAHVYRTMRTHIHTNTNSFSTFIFGWNEKVEHDQQSSTPLLC